MTIIDDLSGLAVRAIPSERLAALGLDLPPVPEPVAAYLPTVRSGAWVWTSGQLPLVEGVLPSSGKVGAGAGLCHPGRGRPAGPDRCPERGGGSRRRGRRHRPYPADREARRIRRQRPGLHRSARGRQRCQRAPAGPFRGCGGACPQRRRGGSPPTRRSGRDRAGRRGRLEVPRGPVRLDSSGGGRLLRSHPRRRRIDAACLW